MSTAVRLNLRFQKRPASFRGAEGWRPPDTRKRRKVEPEDSSMETEEERGVSLVSGTTPLHCEDQLVPCEEELADEEVDMYSTNTHKDRSGP